MPKSEFSAEERAAIRDRARELKKSQNAEADRADALAKIAELEPTDRAIAEAIDELVGEIAPQLKAKTWYGMPAWALDGKAVIFFQSGIKFKTRYSSVGFTQDAKLDDGSIWPTSFALVKLDENAETLIKSLINKSVGGN